MSDKCIIVRGGGDLASGVIHRLHRCGYRVLILECEKPSAIRRKVAPSHPPEAGQQISSAFSSSCASCRFKILLICLISVLFFRTTERVSFWPYCIRQQLVLSIEKMHKVSETFSFKINETAAFCCSIEIHRPYFAKVLYRAGKSSSGRKLHAVLFRGTVLPGLDRCCVPIHPSEFFQKITILHNSTIFAW